MQRFRNVLQASPHRVGDLDKLTSALMSLGDCAASCSACADACLGEQNVQQLARCIALNLDCGEVCKITASMLSRPGHKDTAALEGLLHACIAICRACGDQCQQHAQMHEHCRACAESCHHCRTVCEELAGSTRSIAAAA